jgi:tRNA dimethylallyltransferase
MRTKMPNRLVAIVGATAAGKSELALDIAERIGAEIVSADAYQLYRGMDIGTAKLLPDERRGIPHHQIDVLDVTDEASVAVYQTKARRDIEAITDRGRPVVVVGGSGLYVRALLDEIVFPPTDPALRADLSARAAKEGPGILHAELAELDPVAAATIDRRNTRRIVRALEAIQLTGRPFSATMPQGKYHTPTIQIGVGWDREVLFERIAARVARMWTAGLVDEVRGLVSAGLTADSTAGRAVGYVEVLQMLAGDLTAAETQAAIVQNTRKLVRRQLQWFAKDPRVHWLDGSAPDLGDQAMSVLR